MNNLHHDACKDLQDGAPSGKDCSWYSLDDKSSYSESAAGLVCRNPGCEHIQFTSKIEFRDHILTHVTLPCIRVPRLPIKNSVVSIKHSAEKQESLKVRLKLKSNSGSDTRAFEVVKNTNIVLSGPGGLYCPTGRDDLKTEEPDHIPLNQEKGSSLGPESSVELDNTTVSLSSEEREQRARNIGQVEDDIFRERENLSLIEGEEEEDDDEEEEEEDEEEEEEEEDIQEEPRKDDRERTSADGEQRSLNDKDLPLAPLSPTPSEILRPGGFLAPERLVHDDLPFSGSLPVSSARMVEMNGSTSAVSGSDNDSGHSGSPAAFTGGSGAGSGGEEDSSGQQPFNWDELVANSTSHQSNDATDSSGNDQVGGSQSAGVDDVAADLTRNNVSNDMLDNDPLLLPGATAAGEGEQDNLNLLQNLTADPLHPEVDRGSGGDTEYMSIERLGLGNSGSAPASFGCEVCGERWQDRRMLEDHRALAGHYKCLVMPECSSMVWSTAAELAAHQSSIHGQSQSSPQTASPRVSPQTAAPGPNTPPVQQLAQQVQRLPVPGVPQAYPLPQQPGYMTNAQYPVPGQMGPMIPGQVPQRRYRAPMPGAAGPSQQPYGPGSPGISGAIQPRPLNALVAQGRGQMPGPNRLPPGAMPQRGMVPMQMGGVGQKRPGPPPQVMGQGMPPLAVKRRRLPQPLPQPDNTSKKGDASAVANILATRGITVTAAGAGASSRVGGAQPVRQRVNMPASAPAPASAPVATLNLTSAISIIPTTGSGTNRHQNNSGFAVPQARAQGRPPLVNTSVERPSRPPTVDLTGDGPVPPPGSTRLQMGPSYHRGRGRATNLARMTCQICDKAFASAEMLNQHMTLHRSPGKLPYRCNLCNAQYPTSQGLQQHRQTYHKESLGMSAPLAPGEEMVIPLVDLKQPGVAARLGSLGIHHCIPLSGLGNQSNGYFSLPVVSIDGSRHGAAGNLRSLGASGVLSIGPIKLVPK